MSGLTISVKRSSRGSETLLEAANRILRILGVSSAKRGKDSSSKSKLNNRAPLAAEESTMASPVRLLPNSLQPAKSPNAKRCVADFIFGRVIGEGCYSTVYLAKDIHSGKEYAIKVCDKRHILKEKKGEYIKREKDALNMLCNMPNGFVKLYCTFQDSERLYFVLSYAKNGELLPFIHKVGSFQINTAKFYAAELLLALEKMHGLGLIHRDLKPENILLDEKMHLKIADFGTVKILPVGENYSDDDSNNSDGSNNSDDSSSTSERERQRKMSFVGTAQYVSPELLRHREDTPASDLWAFGCILYQMVSGLPPFRAPNDYLMFQKILKLDYDFPPEFPEDAKDLVEKLLVLDYKQRLGVNDNGDTYVSIRNHPFFDGIDWDGIWDETPPKILPYLPGGSFREEYSVPDHLEPGFGNDQIVRLLEFDLSTPNSNGDERHVLDITPDEKRSRLETQARDCKWHQFVEGELILKHGIVEKRKGLFSRRRMLLLTTGPRLFYVDPVNMVLKGEIPWSADLQVEVKNFRIFLIHTPNRTYYLEDPQAYALEWKRIVEEVRHGTYGAT